MGFCQKGTRQVDDGASQYIPLAGWARLELRLRQEAGSSRHQPGSFCGPDCSALPSTVRPGRSVSLQALAVLCCCSVHWESSQAGKQLSSGLTVTRAGCSESLLVPGAGDTDSTGIERKFVALGDCILLCVCWPCVPSTLDSCGPSADDLLRGCIWRQALRKVE